MARGWDIRYCIVQRANSITRCKWPSPATDGVWGGQVKYGDSRRMLRQEEGVEWRGGDSQGPIPSPRGAGWPHCSCISLAGLEVEGLTSRTKPKPTPVSPQMPPFAAAVRRSTGYPMKQECGEAVYFFLSLSPLLACPLFLLAYCCCCNILRCTCIPPGLGTANVAAHPIYFFSDIFSETPWAGPSLAPNSSHPPQARNLLTLYKKCSPQT